MTLPPITPAQAMQMAAVAQSVGSVAASAFSKLLGSAAEFLGDIGGSTSTDSEPSAASSAGDGTGVLRNQLQSLLDRLQVELKAVFSENGRQLPSSAVIRQDSDGGLATDGTIPLELLTGSGKLMEILRGIFARRQLLDSATGDADFSASPSIRITPDAASFVE